MPNNKFDFLLKPNVLLIVYTLIAVIASIQAIMIGTHIKDGHVFTDYNNYVIFKYSFSHLIQNKNLYTYYLDEQADLYKYSPTFAMFMGLFTKLPDMVGLSIWNCINAVSLFFSIRLLSLSERQKSLLLWFMLLELLTSMQNAQSNGLMAALMIAAFACMEQKKIFLAALWIALATFIKIYGCFAFLLFLFYPGRLKQIVYPAVIFLVLAILPLIFVSPANLLWQYQNWKILLATDKATSYGLSVMGWLHSWFGLNSGKDLISWIGLALLLLPLVRIKMYSSYMFRMLFLASVLIWVIIFNYKAESPTFIIAVAGVGLRHFVLGKSVFNNLIMLFVFLFTCMSPTDLFPAVVRNSFFVPYAIKAIPCIFVWFVTTYELLTLKPGGQLIDVK